MLLNLVKWGFPALADLRRVVRTPKNGVAEIKSNAEKKPETKGK